MTLRQGKIYEMEIEPGSFDLAFESIVLLHILDQQELRKTAEAMKSLSKRVFLCEHTYEGPDFPISKYTLPSQARGVSRTFQAVHSDKAEGAYVCG